VPAVAQTTPQRLFRATAGSGSCPRKLCPTAAATRSISASSMNTSLFASEREAFRVARDSPGHLGDKGVCHRRPRECRGCTGPSDARCLRCWRCRPRVWIRLASWWDRSHLLKVESLRGGWQPTGTLRTGEGLPRSDTAYPRGLSAARAPPNHRTTRQVGRRGRRFSRRPRCPRAIAAAGDSASMGRRMGVCRRQCVSAGDRRRPARSDAVPILSGGPRSCQRLQILPHDAVRCGPSRATPSGCARSRSIPSRSTRGTCGDSRHRQAFGAWAASRWE
jgi:hypothetical protein